MRVALYTPFVVQQNTGIARHIFGLLRGLAAVDRDTRYLCFWPAQVPWPNLPANFVPQPITVNVQNPVARLLRERGWIARAYRQHRFDVIHSPFGYLPPHPPAPSVVTLHDLRVFRFPATFSPLRGCFLRWAVPRSLRRARVVVAISEQTRQEIFRLVPGVSPDRIRVCYPGLDPSWFEPASVSTVAAARERFGLPDRFVLAVGTREPHKNLPRLLEAVARLRQQSDGADLRLVLAGATFASGKSDPLNKVIARLGLHAAVQTLGRVSDTDLPAVYQAAAVLCFPSLYEGFGYPPLEAMAAGTPVVTSRASCLPEVVGDAAELVDPLSIDDIAAGIRTVLAWNHTHKARRVEAGRQQAARYRWEDHALLVRAAYNDAAF